MDENNNFPVGIFPVRIQSIINELNRDRKYPIDYLSGAILWVVSVLIGACSYLKTTLGKTYANIQSIMALPRGMARGQLQEAPMIFDLDTDPLENMAKLPRWECTSSGCGS